MVNRFTRWLLNGLFPQACRLCGLASGRDIPLCHPCQQALPRNWHSCTQCALPLPPLEDTPRICGRCQQQPPAFDAVRAPWLYDQQLAALITPWKYQRDQRLTPLLANLLLTGEPAGPPPDLLIAMPLHWRRLLWRGFNQSEELLAAAVMQRQTLAAACSNVLRCTRQTHSPAQSGLNARQRSALPANAFTVQGRCDNLRVALVDDVVTTGATAHSLSRQLKAAGASHIEVWCIARTPTPDASWM